jgi:hypothetical protein
VYRTPAARIAMFGLVSVFAFTVANEQLPHSFFKKVRLCQRIGRLIIFFFETYAKPCVLRAF